MEENIGNNRADSIADYHGNDQSSEQSENGLSSNVSESKANESGTSESKANESDTSESKASESGVSAAKPKKKKLTKEVILEKLRGLMKFLLNPHLVICLAIGWIITNGWAYAFVGVGAYYDIVWMRRVAEVYLAILWSPLCMEGIFTVLIAIFVMKIVFPNDKNTLGVLQGMFTDNKNKIEEKKNKIEEKKNKIKRNKKKNA